MDDRHSDNDQPPPTTNDSPSTSDNLGVTISPVTLSLLARLVQNSGNGGLALNSSQLLSLFSQIDAEDDDDDVDADDDDDGDYHPAYQNLLGRQRSSVPPESVNWRPAVTEPQEPGAGLLFSGEYGRIGPKARERAVNPSNNIAQTIARRSEGRGRRSLVSREDLASSLVPNTDGTAVASYGSNIYTAQYSKDSTFYYTCSQDFRLYMFDSSMPRASMSDRIDSQMDPYIDTNMAVKRRIQGHPGRWTITDANLSPDNQRMIYSSITPTVHMTSTVDENPSQIPIPFADNGQGDDDGDDWTSGIYSCTFSADGNEIVAGGNGMIFVYDLLANRRSVRIRAHNDDVNSCCWADTASGNILVSASDDSFLKVWDRRSLGTSPKPSGVLMGHTEGITYVSAKGDGRYVISNGKDQTLRLWDLRKMRSSLEHETERKSYGIRGFDYRYPPYRKPKYDRHPLDCSVMTYHGHSVLRTLIRCHFSPAETTGGQYLYSGSADGKVHIWSLDGRVVQTLDRSKTLSLGFDPSAPEPVDRTQRKGVCVRDVSWHSQEPVMMSAGWDSGRGGSILARHEWKGLNKMQGNLKDWVQKHDIEALEGEHRVTHSQNRRSVGTYMPGAFTTDSDIPSDEE